MTCQAASTVAALPPRYRRMLAMLTSGREVSVREFARVFGVAAMTVRRDLAALQAAGRVFRTHGGAVLPHPASIGFSSQRRTESMSAQKKALARVAAAVGPGAASYLDTGTTTLEVAKSIAHVQHLTVLTSSLAISAQSYHCDNIQLVLLGGQERKNSPDLFGELALANIGRFHTHLAFLCADAVNRRGLYTTDASVATVSCTMIGNTDRCILVADSGKFAGSAFARFAGREDIDTVIADSSIRPSDQRWLRKMVRKLVVVRAGRFGSGQCSER